jgi:hypothetical protein
MLKCLGWRFHRIWSSKWSHHRDKALERVVSAYEDAVVRADEEDGLIPRKLTGVRPASGTVDLERVKVHVANDASRAGKVPVEPGYTIDSYTEAETMQVVTWVSSDRLLRTEDEVVPGSDGCALVRAARQENCRHDHGRNPGCQRPLGAAARRARRST